MRRKEILSQVNVRVEGSKWRDADSANVKVFKVFMKNIMYLLIVVTNIAKHQSWNLGVKEDANTVLTNFVTNTPPPECEKTNIQESRMMPPPPQVGRRSLGSAIPSRTNFR